MSDDGFRAKMRRIIDGHGETHIQRKKHRMKFIIGVGTILTLIVFIAMLCIGPTKIMDPIEALSNLFSALGKDGSEMTPEEVMVFSSRLPRALAALVVGVGLSIAGAGYQAIIRNPLVDPYIMGVSSGAGTFAIAVIAFEFTFFGLISPNSIYLVAVAAIVGGLLAFLLTMALANRAGGTTNAYVLSGVVIGLVFGAIQTMMIVFSGNKVSDVLLWLFGSFANITWEKALFILVPVVIISLLIFKYARELNLVLLGENQASQMGLNVKRFNALILTLASIMTAFCVAFCGIIGFVGLVVPHLCRMLFGGDHRLVLPGSIALGGVLMMAADLAARMIIPGNELPVGAITTLIGVPVFAYLLFIRGKMYNG
ncbi:MAG: iron ABC transporter permease [Candidatus Methanomethylophilaceae archaeon]|jgi:iron complex transport system permease protein|nr:iron ABC transporter permease [Candidatus Methanomethylophilaceae archaeon]MBP5685385.1 iron ABC transporter permease [Candidatus Methanomethylophilaceae archaeon]